MTGRPPLDELFAAPAPPARPTLDAIFANQAPKPSATYDTVASLGGGLERGLAAAPMVIPNLVNGLFAGPQLLARGVYHNAMDGGKALGLIPQDVHERSDAELPPIWQPFLSSEDVLQSLPAGARPHDPQTPGGVAADLIGQLAGGVAGTKAIQRAAAASPTRPSPDDLFGKADQLYTAADAHNAVIGGPKIQATVGQIKAALTASGYDPDFHPETAKWLAKLETAAADPAGTPTDLPWAKVNGYRKLLNGVVRDAAKKGGTEDGYQARTALQALDDAMGGVRPGDLSAGDPAAIALTKQANGVYAAANRADQVQQILDNARLTDNPATAIRNGFRTLARSVAKNPTGWTDDEIAAITHAGDTGLVTGALKTLGSRLLAGVAGTAAGAAGGGVVGAPAGLVAGEVAAMPFRSAAAALQAARGKAVLDAIAQRPAVQAALPAPSVQPPPNAASVPTLAAPAAAAAAELSRPGDTPARITIRPQDARPPVNLPQIRPPQAAADPLIDKMAQAESSNDPAAKSATSSASGLLQFTDRTWKDLVLRYGKQTGITLGMKDDPDAQRTMAGLYARQNLQSLQQSLGRLPTQPELYMAHVLGARGAATLINQADSAAPAALLFPGGVVRANKPLFFRKGQPVSAAQLYSTLSDKVS